MKASRGLEVISRTSFSTLLKRYRQAGGLSQEALAERAGLSARAISNLERGINRTPRYDTLELLSSALSLTPQQRDLLLASARPEVASSVDSLPVSPAPNLPLPPTRLVGREQESTAALALLRGGASHLLTLTGPSGVGKTRLALQLAWNLAPDFADGVVYVPLAAIRDASLVPGVVAQVLGIHEQAHASTAEQVRAYLHHRHFLLVLDNLEQVMDCTSFVASLLEQCPRLSVLVTSRTPLRLRAEQELLLAPLPLDDAVTLFRERAQVVRPDQAYAESDVLVICEQVDRLPLAIELAAMHVKVLSLPELRKQLTHRLALLRWGPRDLPVQQQTMEDAIAWSYELLTERQQRCFRALGVFEGGWTLEAAEAVCLPGPAETAGETTSAEVILMLAALVDASLIQTDVLANGEVRFHMLELVRDYARQQLHTLGEEEHYQRQHAAYYARLAEKVMAYFGPEQGVRDALAVIAWTQESPNARAALHWAEETQEAELGLRLASFGRLWHIHGQMSETERWYVRMLDLDLWARAQGKPTAPLTLRIYILYGLGRTMVRHGKASPAAEAAAREALQLAQQIADHHGISSAYATLGMVAQANGRLDEAAKAYSESYRYAQLIDQNGLTCRALFHRAELAGLRGDTARARILLEEAQTLAREAGLIWEIPIMTTLLGHLATQQRDYEGAKTRYREALTLYRSFGSPTYTAGCLEGYASALGAEGNHVLATRFCAAAAALRERTQTSLLPVEREAVEQVIATAKAALDAQTFAAAWATGAAYTHEEAIDKALSDASA